MGKIMLTTAIKESMSESVLCWLATVDNDGMPNNSPKEVFIPYSADEMLIANIASPNSVKNIINNPNVCVSFVHIFKQKGYKLKGIARYFEKDTPKFKELFKNIYPITGNKYPVNGIISIKINDIKPILAPSYFLYPDLTEEEQIESAHKTYGV